MATTAAGTAGAMDREGGDETEHERLRGGEGDAGGESGCEATDGSDSDGAERHDGSDTARIAQSVMEYTRRCLLSGAFSKALVALQSAVEIAEMPSLAYRRGVLQTAQVLKAAHEFEASVTCMQAIYQHMPAPYSRDAGVLLIARLYEQLQRWDCAQFWAKKLGGGGGGDGDGGQDERRLGQQWRALAELAFEQRDFVFAADAFAQALARAGRRASACSARTAYRYLWSLTQSAGPCAAAHGQQRQLEAWHLAQRFRGARARYGDAHYWLLRALFARCFPRISRAVFEWDAAFARTIARWWKARRARVVAASANSAAAAPLAAPRASPDPQQVASGLGPRRDKQPSRRKTRKQRRGHKASGREAAATASGAEPPPRTRRGTQDATPGAAAATATAAETDPIAADDDERAAVALSDHARARAPRSPPRSRSRSRRPPVDSLEASRTKRKLGAVRRLRKQRLSDDVRPTTALLAAHDDAAAAGDNDADADADERAAAPSPRSLLQLYPLRVTPPTAAACEPGPADLDVHALAEFARVAHYRARVIRAELGAAGARPRWLLALDRAVALLASARPRLEDDSIAHLAEIHARLVLQLSAVCREYAGEFGATAFVLRLQRVTRRLAGWKFRRVAELTEALAAARRLAVAEEQRRSLEFFHLQRRQQAERATDGRAGPHASMYRG